MTSSQFLSPRENTALEEEEERSEPLDLEMQRPPRKEFLFFSQVALIFIVILSAIINISLNNGKQEVWIILLSTGIGVLLPNPKLGRRKNFKYPETSLIRSPSATP